MMNILFICKDRGQYKNGKFGLWNSAKLIADAIKNRCRNISTVCLFDANRIDKEIHLKKPDLIVLEALWVTPEKLLELSKLHPNVKWLVRVHSKAAFLAQEGIAFDWIKKYTYIPNVQVSTNNLDFNNDMEHLNIDSVYLPNIYNPDYKIVREWQEQYNVINIGCFGALRIMKNQVSQAIAAIKFANLIGKQLHFHINENSDGGVDNILRNLKALFACTTHKLVIHPWYAHDDFCNIVAKMDIGMQVSLSESFNIVSADFVYAGVPIITSPEITFVNHMFHCANNTSSMVRALFVAYYGDCVNLQHLNKRLLLAHNAEALGIWNRYLEDIDNGSC